MNKPQISVLMPIYRTNEQYLRTAIESILSQSFQDFEFLIIDDCPEDDRESIVKSYQDNRIRYYKNKQNLGITPTRNKLIELSKGEYLAIFDHDDISLPTRLEKQAKYLDEYPEVGVVGCWREDFPQKEIYKFPSSDLEIKTQLMDLCVLTHSASMIRKSVLDEHNIRYEEEYSPAEDYCLWLRLIEFTNFYNIPEVLFKYRLHPDNTTKHQQNKMSIATERLQLWSRNKYPYLYQSYEHTRPTITKIKLLGIPLFKIFRKGKKIKVYLFNFIPFLSINKKGIIWFK